MSADIVDDLHAAEDAASTLAFQLAAVLDADAHNNVPPAYRHETQLAARATLATWQTYCRPTCQAYGDANACEDDDPECCGCPCDHGSPDEEADT